MLVNNSFWELEYLDGDRHLARSPSLIKKISEGDILLNKVVRQWQLALLTEVTHNTILKGEIWPPESVDAVCFNHHRVYYQKLADLLGIPKIDGLTARSRHTFFVCGQPNEKRGIYELSGLEQLMGYAYIEKSESRSAAKHQISTGDDDLDLLTSAVLTFKAQALPVARLLSKKDLLSCIVYANEKLAEAHRQATNPKQSGNGKVANPVVARKMDEAFEKKKAEIAAELEGMGVALPKGF
jgi:hypothetical protein